MERKEGLYISTKKLSISTELLLGQMMKGSGLTAAQGYLLLYIGEQHPDGTFATNLHKELGLSMATVSVGVKQLRQKGFLTVVVSPNDERQKKLIPTSKFKKVAVQISSAIYKTEEAIYGELNQEEKETLHYLLQKMLSRIEKSCPDSTIFEK